MFVCQSIFTYLLHINLLGIINLILDHKPASLNQVQLSTAPRGYVLI